MNVSNDQVRQVVNWHGHVPEPPNGNRVDAEAIVPVAAHDDEPQIVIWHELRPGNGDDLQATVTRLVPQGAPRARIDNSVALLRRYGVSPDELEQFVDTMKGWQTGRTIAQGATVFACGFLMLGPFNYLKAENDWSFGEKDMDKLLTYLANCGIAGFGGTFGSRVIENGRLTPDYFKGLGRSGEQLVPAAESRSGRALDYSAFWPFAISHAIVELVSADADPETRAFAKLISACAATLATCVHKAYLPRRVLTQDPTALLNGDPQKNVETGSLIEGLLEHQRQRLSPCTAASNYLSGWFKGLGDTVGRPSYATMTRALWHTVAAAIALGPGVYGPELAPEKKSDDAVAAAVLGAVWLGCTWGWLSGLGRRAVADIEGQARANLSQPAHNVAPHREPAEV